MDVLIRVAVFVLLTNFRLISGNSIPASTTSDFASSYNFAPNLTAGLETAKLESKPLILLVHSTRCGGCKRVRDALATSDDIKSLSDKFVVVSALDGQDPEASRYAPDGFYVPRIIFFRSDGTVLPEVGCANKEVHKYSYRKSEDILKSMREVLINA